MNQIKFGQEMTRQSNKWFYLKHNYNRKYNVVIPKTKYLYHTSSNANALQMT